MNCVSRHIDLTQVPAVPWAWVDEHVYAAIRGCSVKVLQNERRLNIGCRFRRINGAYEYLPASVRRFPRPARMLQLMQEAGFTHAAWDGYLLHAAGLYRGVKA